MDTHGASSVNEKHGQSSPTSRYAIVRMQVKKETRVLGAMKVSMLGKAQQSVDIVETTSEILPGGRWMKLTPKQPLDIDEYALVEILSPKEFNLAVWDFGVNPRSPEAKNAISSGGTGEVGGSERRPLRPGFLRSALRAPVGRMTTLRQRPATGSPASGGLDWVFEFAVLDLFLTVDAVGRPGKRFEALDADGFSAVEAFAIGAFRDAVEGGANAGYLDVSVSSLAEEQLLLIGGDGLIGDILSVVGAGFASLLDGREHGALKVRLLLQEFLLKVAGVYGWLGHYAYSFKTESRG